MEVEIENDFCFALSRHVSRVLESCPSLMKKERVDRKGEREGRLREIEIELR
jgi:hypothetical protein